MNLAETFEKFDDEYCHFERVDSPPHPRPDISAFIVLDKLLPKPGHDMICAAEHDEIYLDADCEALAAAASEDDILMLLRCGVRFDRGFDCLAMYV